MDVRIHTAYILTYALKFKLSDESIIDFDYDFDLDNKNVINISDHREYSRQPSAPRSVKVVIWPA